MNKLQILSATNKNFFTPQEIGVLWDYHDKSKLYEIIKHYVRTKSIFAISRGLYATKDYQVSEIRSDTELVYEIANKLVPGSYVSLATVLASYGAVTQYYDAVFSVARHKSEREVLGIKFVYRRVKESILLNDLGILKKGELRIAGLERALCDSLYLDPTSTMPEYGSVDKAELLRVASLYDNESLMRKIKKWIKEQSA